MIGRLAAPLAAHHDVDAVIAEDALEEADIGEPRHVVEDERLIGQEACDHQRKRRVLCSRNRNNAVKRPAADNANTIHDYPHGPIRTEPLVILLPARIAAKVRTGRRDFGVLRRHGLICRTVPGAAARLRLAALEIFPQCRRQPLAARGPFLGFAVLDHGFTQLARNHPLWQGSPRFLKASSIRVGRLLP